MSDHSAKRRLNKIIRQDPSVRNQIQNILKREKEYQIKKTGIKMPVFEEDVSFCKKPCDGDNHVKHYLQEKVFDFFNCVVCLDLPIKTIFQCRNGHLMCMTCYNYLIRQSKLRNEPTRCPICRINITLENSTRNLVVQNILSELPSKCKYCFKIFSKNLIHSHMDNFCEKRLVNCPYRLLTCKWRGEYVFMEEHKINCEFPSKSAISLIEELEKDEKLNKKNENLYKDVMKIISSEIVNHYDLLFSSNYTEEYFPKLYYKSNTFKFLQEEWRVIVNVMDPRNYVKKVNNLYYKLELLSNNRLNDDLLIQYILLPAINSKIYHNSVSNLFKNSLNDGNSVLSQSINNSSDTIYPIINQFQFTSKLNESPIHQFFFKKEEVKLDLINCIIVKPKFNLRIFVMFNGTNLL
ncbi:Cysteine and histidine-rich protein 1 [Intoshia linei]|uniref:Cysteine and histidine-rich protein 1 n=1 Tax=Intoshia linei TaxID=1819745 RepID=A0A177AV78_9BILA|nr:Cysteine and histidine-rich protein 1 [Intoshia linei]